MKKYKYIVQVFTSLTLLSLFAMGDLAFCKEYYLGSNGQDTNPGTIELPFKTIDKANSVVNAGDVVIFLAGEYAGKISPANDGMQGKPIIYRSNEPKSAVLRGMPYSYAITLVNKKNIEVEGFYIKPENGSWISVKESENIVIRNCKMEGNRWSSTGIYFLNSRFIHILDNELFRSDYVINDIGYSSNGLSVDYCENVIVRGNYFNRFAHSLSSFKQTSNLVIRDNLFNGLESGPGRSP